jgi:hypothetical protein
MESGAINIPSAGAAARLDRRHQRSLGEWLRTARADPAELDAAGLLALAAFLLLVLSGRAIDLLPSPARMALVLAWPVVAVGFLLTRRVGIVIAYVILGGLLLRWVDFPGTGSDHLAATAEGIDVLLGGGNPYDHVYLDTRPPGQPVSQPPGEFLVHLPGFLWAGVYGVMFTQLALAAGLMAAAAFFASRVSWLAGLPALALYAGLPNLIFLNIDGSNDTGTGVLLTAGIVGLAGALHAGAPPRGLRAAGLLLALAMSTKQTTLLVGVVLCLFVWQRLGPRGLLQYAGAGLALLGALSVPFLLADPGAYLTGILKFIGAHEDIYGWNIWVFAQGMGWPVLDEGPVALLALATTGAALLAVSQRPFGALAWAVLASVIVTLTLLLTARWTTFAYFAMVAPLLLAMPMLAVWERRWPPPDSEPATEPMGAARQQAR